MNEEPKPIGEVKLLVYPDGKIAVSSSFTDQNQVRAILKTAEEAIIQIALTKASLKSNIVQPTPAQILKIN